MLDEVITEDDLCLGCGGNITPTLFPGFLCQGCRESYGQKMRLIEQGEGLPQHPQEPLGGRRMDEV